MGLAFAYLRAGSRYTGLWFICFCIGAFGFAYSMVELFGLRL